MHESHPSNPLWKPQQLAEFLGVPVSFVYDRTCRGAGDPIPRLKIGKYIRFNPDEVKKWLDAHCDILGSGSLDRESHSTSTK